MRRVLLAAPDEVGATDRHAVGGGSEASVSERVGPQPTRRAGRSRRNSQAGRELWPLVAQ